MNKARECCKHFIFRRAGASAGAERRENRPLSRHVLVSHVPELNCLSTISDTELKITVVSAHLTRIMTSWDLRTIVLILLRI